ncbi:OmpA family protein [Modestobacter sp. I12A-02628]|uniref:OmpA family protein n=1 Tax=Goekera deserti TaxID=2497753 RepID=A0A7K3WGB6_9ACTN|nr:flagellar motor protein MotB [Goekera deserti]MPQ99492.1 OmpA family protein [Goekera deserti]NDI48979.1 OmpA family protein [Goekera deserti]NEL55551.1 OmpA family protein [Goekera deserti]
MSGGGHAPKKGRRAQHHEEEEHENHERWLVSYADMVTLLMVLFIVLFAISQVDAKKFDQLATGLAESFGAPITSMGQGASSEASVFDGYPSPVQVTEDVPESKAEQSAEEAAAAAKAAAAAAEATQREAQATYDQLAAAKAALQAALDAAGYPNAAKFEITERGLVVHVIADQLLFDAEQAVLRAPGKSVLDAIAPTLRGLPQDIAVEGHANSLPVTPGGRYSSNWQLSTDRASVIVEYITTTGRVAEDRMSATGYSSTKPLLPDSDPNAMSVNRRVDVVVLSDASSAANQLLPVIDAAQN